MIFYVKAREDKKQIEFSFGFSILCLTSSLFCRSAYAASATRANTIKFHISSFELGIVIKIVPCNISLKSLRLGMVKCLEIPRADSIWDVTIKV